MTAELVLYQYAGDDELPSISPPCTKVGLALRRLELPHRVADVRSPFEIRRVSATGRLPALGLGERLVTDSIAILDLLEERAGRSLSPADPRARAHDLAWEHFANSALYWLGLYMRWRVPANRKRLLDALFDSALVRAPMGVLLTKRITRRCRAHGIGGCSPEQVLAKFESMLGVLRDGLGAGPFLDDRPTPGRGDLAVASFLVQIGWRGVTPRGAEIFAGFPALNGHLRRTLEACGVSTPSWVRGE